MKFLVIIQPDQWGGLPRGERTIEADGAMVSESGVLGFYIGNDDDNQVAWFAPGCWHSVFKILDDGSIVMRPVGVQ